MRVEKRERFYGRKKKMDAAIGGASRDIGVDLSDILDSFLSILPFIRILTLSFFCCNNFSDGYVHLLPP